VEVPALNLASMAIYAEGSRAFAEARERDRGLEPQHLRVLFDPEFLRANPVVPCPTWETMRRDIAESRGSDTDVTPLIGNMSAWGVLFGALHDSEFWDDLQTRQDFILALLQAGSNDDPLVGTVVERTLFPPMTVPLRDGTPASYLVLDQLRGQVGFTDAHLNEVQDVIDMIQDSRNFVPGDPYQQYSRVTRGGGRLRRDLNPRGYLPQWTALMKDRILTELGKQDSKVPSARDGTLAEQILYWNDRFANDGIDAAWLDAKPYILGVFSGEFPHPNDARIKELEAKDPLSQWEQQDLDDLKQHRERDRDKIAGHLCMLYAEHALPGDVEREFDDVEGKLGENHAHKVDRVVRDGWMRATLRNPEFFAGRLRESYSGTEAPRLSKRGESAAVDALQIASRGSDAYKGTLLMVAREGSPNARFVALGNSRHYNDGEYQGLIRKAIQDSPQEHGGLVVNSLYNRVRYQSGDPKLAVELLVDTFEGASGNLWKERTLVSDENRLTWVANALPSEVWERLMKSGSLPERLVMYRKK
ncbi:MAG: hypothetical protein KDD53_05700, partial [Bdellovibrionales bacterium]|nr:hypothetical protein [Bdellovibrionales bacterium]